MNSNLDCRNCESPHCVCIVSISILENERLTVNMDFSVDTRMRIDDIERKEKRFVIHTLLLHCGLREAIEKCVNDENERGRRVPTLNKKVNSLPPPYREAGDRSYHLTYISKNPTMDIIMKICSMIDDFFQNEIFNFSFQDFGVHL